MRSKSAILTTMLILLCVQVGHSSYPRVPLKALVGMSDLIVIGTLEGVTSAQQEDIDHPFRSFTGTIKVETSLLGNAPDKGMCELRWNIGGPLRLAIQDRENEKGIWLLQARSGSSNSMYFTADYPDRFLSLDRLSELQAILRSPLYDLTIEEPDNFLAGPLMAVFRIRTVSAGLQLVDYPSVVGNQLVLNGQCRISFEGADVPFLQEPRRPEDCKAITITPDNPYSLRIDLAKYFKFTQARSYTIWWGIGETDSSPRYNFYIKDEIFRKKE